MRFANQAGRAVIVRGDDAIDVAEASDGRFGPDPHAVLAEWGAFAQWAESLDTRESIPLDRTLLGCPSPTPRQIMAVGLNYHAHAAESGFASPDQLPPTFTKFVSSLTGPDTVVELPDGGNTDWEVELVVVIGFPAYRVSEADAWDAVAGLTLGQDLSERITQLQGPAPQFSLGKSFPGFAPVGPWLVTVDEFANRDDIALGCAIDGETVQDGRTRDLIFSVPALISRISAIAPLYPGDLIFTGTPSGVGQGREPRRFLQAGESLTTWAEGIGELHQQFVSTPVRAS